MARRKRRKFNPEFKAKAVRLARVGDRSIQQIATDLDLTESALRNWIHQAEVDAGQAQSAPDALTSAEKSELSELRREVKKLRQERDILKAAATYFAKESEGNTLSSRRRKWPSRFKRCARSWVSLGAATTLGRSARSSAWTRTR